MSESILQRGDGDLGGRRIRRRAGTLLLVLCLTGATFLGAPGAGADDVDGLAARADDIAHQLMDLRGRMAVIGEEFNQSQVRREELKTQKVDIERRTELAQAEMAERRADAAQYAMSTYVGLGEGDVLSMALDGRQWDLSRRTGYATISIGDRQQLVDDLRAAQKVNDDLVEALADANRAEDRITADLERQQAEATRLLAEQETLQNSVQGELAEAVAERQAELAAAQARADTRAAADTDAPAATGRTSASAAPSVAGDQVARGPAARDSSGSTTPDRPAPTTGPGTGPSPNPNPSPTPTPSPTRPPTTAPPVTAPPPVVTPPPSRGGQTVANAAVSQLDVPYSWGGGTASGPSMGFGPGAGIVGFDCSGLTLYAWAKVGVYLPHSAQMQYDRSAKVALSQLQPGDLVFYGSSSRGISHVSVYVGGGQVVHAPNSRSVVQYGAVHLLSGYYPWIGAGRPG